MRTYILIFYIFLVACNRGENEKPPVRHGLANDLFVIHEYAAFGGEFVVESSFVHVGDSIGALYDPHASGSLYFGLFGADFKGLLNKQEIEIPHARFSYVINDGDGYSMLVTEGNSVEHYFSSDLKNWTFDQVVLSPSTKSNDLNFQQWNASHDFETESKVHVVVESGSSKPNQEDVRLIYYKGENGLGSLEKTNIPRAC